MLCGKIASGEMVCGSQYSNYDSQQITPFFSQEATFLSCDILRGTFDRGPAVIVVLAQERYLTCKTGCLGVRSVLRVLSVSLASQSIKTPKIS